MTEFHHSGDLAPGWLRRQWLKLVASIEDHPRIAFLCFLLAALLMIFYAFRLDGIGHFRESFARWRLENFGGVHEVNRSVRTPDLLLSLKPQPSYDRLDILSPVSLHFTGTAFRKELQEMGEKGGKIRLVALDPRISDSFHPNHARFGKLAEAFGQDPFTFRARCWYTTAILLELQEELKETLALRLLTRPLPKADPPYFCFGQSVQVYSASDPRSRMDILMPRPTEPEPPYSDRFTHPEKILKNRPDHPAVKQSSEAFETAWTESMLVDEELRRILSQRLHGEEGY